MRSLLSLMIILSVLNTLPLLANDKKTNSDSKIKNLSSIGLLAPEVVLGSIDSDIIRRILQDHIPQFRKCYNSVLLKTQKKTGGSGTLKFTIQSSGVVIKAGFTTKNKLVKKIKTCVINAIKKVRFPEPLHGKVVEVSLPINFYPRN